MYKLNEMRNLRYDRFPINGFLAFIFFQICSLMAAAQDNFLFITKKAPYRTAIFIVPDMSTKRAAHTIDLVEARDVLDSNDQAIPTDRRMMLKYFVADDS